MKKNNYTRDDGNVPIQNPSSSWAENFEKYGADGVDFVKIGVTRETVIKHGIIRSYTKAQILNGEPYPKSNYFFWKMENGRKVYINESE